MEVVVWCGKKRRYRTCDVEHESYSLASQLILISRRRNAIEGREVEKTGEVEQTRVRDERGI